MFSRLVEEFRRTPEPQGAANEQQQAVDIVLAEACHLYTREEVENIIWHGLGTFRFALASVRRERLEE